MKIIVGSKNPNKVDAVREVFAELFPNDLEVIGIEVSSDISDQPLSMSETIRGAVNRAKNAFVDCDMSVGIEGGLMEVPESPGGHMQFEACILYDGTNSYLGFSGAFAVPKDVIETIKREGINLSAALKKHGHTDHEYIGHDQGLVGILTKGKVDRKAYTIHALELMLAHYKSKEMFQ